MGVRYCVPVTNKVTKTGLSTVHWINIVECCSAIKGNKTDTDYTMLLKNLKWMALRERNLARRTTGYMIPFLLNSKNGTRVTQKAPTSRFLETRGKC